VGRDGRLAQRSCKEVSKGKGKKKKKQTSMLASGNRIRKTEPVSGLGMLRKRKKSGSEGGEILDQKQSHMCVKKRLEKGEPRCGGRGEFG